MMHRVLSAAAVVALLSSGCSGSTGAQGEPGAQGSTGAQGATGASGAQGASGAAGATGAPGAAGAQGDAGPQGPAAPTPDAGTSPPPAVYILSNAVTSNAIIEYARSSTTGELAPFGEFPTGGAGSGGGGIGSQGALAFDPTSNHFFAVNAGDSTISELALNLDGSLTLLSNVPSGGTTPISLTVSGSTLYVLNAGTAAVAANIAGFTIEPAGLVPNGSMRPLSTAQPGAEQISFVQNGSVLVVTEKGADNIDTFVVSDGGAAAGHFTPAGTGMAPYGFGVSGDGLIVVSQAASPTGASSYSISASGGVTTDTAFVMDGQEAACWVTIVDTTAYALNAHNETISAYTITPGSGAITLVGDGGTPAATTGTLPTDIAASPDGAFLYTRNGAGESISSWPIAADGSLGATTTFAGIPASSAGLVVR